jgi:serine/threonine protein kinase
MNIINDRYTLDKKIGSGSFGDVYIGYDKADKHIVAIKIETSKTKILKHEYDVYIDIKKEIKLPEIYWYGELETGSKALVMQFLGNSLEYLFTRKCKGVFSCKTTLMIGIQIIKLLHGLHESNYIHRDIKPDNFLTGLKDDKNLYLIDLGLAKRFKSPERVHLNQSNGKNIIGTARYSSINSHLGIELSRRDDLESLAYMLIYFMKGKLPWQGLASDTKSDKYKLIGEMKQKISINELCEGVPEEFKDYLVYVRNLEFKQKPNYKYLYELFTKAFSELNYTWDTYDWERV